MHLETIGHTAPSGSYIRTTLLTGTGVKAVDTTCAALRDVTAAYMAAGRDLAAARDVVQRFDGSERDAATAAGRAGEAPDAAGRKKRKALAVERLEDAEYEWEALAGRVDAARSDYLTALSHNMPLLRSTAASDAEDAMSSLTTALQLSREARSSLEASVVALAQLPWLAMGAPGEYVRPPADAGDEFDDSGHPGIHAAIAEDSLVKAIGWTRRHIDRSNEVEAARKATEKADKLAEKAEG